ncbi:hypothetical protein ONZ51_g457 [Trametes cubensis]|uniref:Uncharacterized protein n=1 Tax=Trametes cubensis TaxID=1111947 RepID=A0AAD7U397_9APHY|nr:hypothetical protein ONZ51_g457 [Trametes cubensis]
MIKLYPDSEEDSSFKGNDNMADDGQLSSSPVSVMSIERAGRDAVMTVKKAIAGKEDLQDAVLACNTQVLEAYLPTYVRLTCAKGLLRDIAFQLTLVQTMLHDNQEQITRLKNEVERARAAESAARLQTDGYNRALQRSKKERAALEGKLKEQQKRYELLHQQCVLATEDATRQHVRVAQLIDDAKELSAELQQWKEHATKAKRKYYALRNEMKELKKAAQGGPRPGHKRADSDELEVV